MRQYLARARTRLTVEPLPGYAPDLKPVEQIWGNLKGRELANLCPTEILAWPCAGRCGMASRGFVGARTSPSVFFV
jgi:putative transposase